MSSLIRYPKNLSADLKRQIRASFQNALNSFDDDDIAYVQKKCRRVIARLANTDDWHSDVAIVADALFGEFHSLIESDAEEPITFVVGASLFYLCSPFDIIPIHHTRSSYLDDAYVLDLCLRQLERDAPIIFTRIENALLQQRTA